MLSHEHRNSKLYKLYTILFITTFSSLLCFPVFYSHGIEISRYILIWCISIFFLLNNASLKTLLHERHFLALLLFLAIACTSLLLNNRSLSNVDEILNWILVFSSGFLVSPILGRHRNHLTLLLPLTLFVVFILVPLLLGDGFSHLDLSAQDRLHFFFQKRANHLGLLCGISALIALQHALFEEDPAKKMFALLLGATSFILLVRTGARAAFIGAVITGIWVLTWKYRSKPKKIIFALLILLFATGTAYHFHIFGHTRLATINSDLNQDKSLIQRKLTWNIAVDSFLDNPLLGNGFDAFGDIYDAKKKSFEKNPDFAKKYPQTIVSTNNAHNFSLHFLTETGIFGLAAMTFFWFSIVVSGILRNTQLTFIVSATYVLSYIAFQLNMSLYGSQLSTVLFALAGMASYEMQQAKTVHTLTSG